uniref:Uncharacterized protein n=1 Tax=Arundo donax TaxID=35708 RepID=A0A0A9FAW7_ARUDO
MTTTPPRPRGSGSSHGSGTQTFFRYLATALQENKNSCFSSTWRRVTSIGGFTSYQWVAWTPRTCASTRWMPRRTRNLKVTGLPGTASYWE